MSLTPLLKMFENILWNPKQTFSDFNAIYNGEDFTMKLKMLIDSMEKVNYIHSFREEMEDVIEHEVNRQKNCMIYSNFNSIYRKKHGIDEETMALHKEAERGI